MEFIQEHPWILIYPITIIIGWFGFLTLVVIRIIEKHLMIYRLLSMNREDAIFIDNSRLLNGKPPNDKSKVIKLPSKKDIDSA